MTSDHQKANAGAPKREPRGRSTIEFPYSDLDDAVQVVQAVFDVGGSDCTWDQLAAKMGQAPKGGGFRLRVMAARTFGLLEYDRGDVTLTDLGLKIVDQKFLRAARVEAFLNVELFKAVFEKFKGNPLPPIAALERQIEQLGVAPKQKDKARQVFMRAAKQAGFFEMAADRLVQPNTKSTGSGESPPPLENPPGTGGTGGSGGGGSDQFGSNLHPLIRGLFEALPKAGEEWPLSARTKWLQAAANNFDLIYADPSETEGSAIKVSVITPSGGLA